MRFLFLLFLLIGCTTTKKYLSAPQDTARETDSKYLQDEITRLVPAEDLDQNLSRFYISDKNLHISALPLTGAVIDSIGFLQSKRLDYDKYEYKKISAKYRSFIFNKKSCFFVFIKAQEKFSDLNNYQIFVSNIGEEKKSSKIKSELEHQDFLKTLNGIFPKTYQPQKARSIETTSVYSQELVCSEKIDFKKPFFIQFQSNSDDKSIIELYWL